MNLKPLCERIICKRIPAETELASGIVLTPGAAGKTQLAIAVAVGPGDPDEYGNLTPMDVRVGDKIMFGEHAGQTMRHDGEEYFVIRNRDVMAVID